VDYRCSKESAEGVVISRPVILVGSFRLVLQLFPTLRGTPDIFHSGRGVCGSNSVIHVLWDIEWVIDILIITMASNPVPGLNSCPLRQLEPVSWPKQSDCVMCITSDGGVIRLLWEHSTESRYSLWTRGVRRASGTRFYQLLSEKWLITPSELHSGRRVWPQRSTPVTDWRAIHSWSGI